MANEIAERQLERSRWILEAPEPQAAWWSSLIKSHRIVLLRNAGVDPALHSMQWDRFTYEQRRRILNASKRLAGWSGKRRSRVACRSKARMRAEGSQ